MKQKDLVNICVELIYRLTNYSLSKKERRKISLVCGHISKITGIEVPKSADTNYYNGLMKEFADKNGKNISKKIIPFAFKDLNKKSNGKKIYAVKTESQESYREMAQKFYRSGEWRALRYEILKENKGKCSLCGRGAKDGVIIHVDHIIPLSKDWSRRLDKNNLQVLCDDCNLGKSNKDSTDWRAEPYRS